MAIKEEKQIEEKRSESFIWIIACALLFWIVFALFLIHTR